MIKVLVKILRIYLIGTEAERDAEGKRALSMHRSTLQPPAMAGLGQVQAERWEFNLGVPRGYQEPSHSSHLFCFP